MVASITLGSTAVASVDSDSETTTEIVVAADAADGAVAVDVVLASDCGAIITLAGCS